MACYRTVNAMKVKTLEDMKAVWRKAGRKGGKARKDKLSATRLSEIARSGGIAKAARAKAA